MKLAIIRIGGAAHLKHNVADTLRSFSLDRKFACKVVEDSPVVRGMLALIKDQVTWGELSPELEPKVTGLIHLKPPRGGFERRGTKISFAAKGALGNRGEKINDLLKRMM